MYFAKTVEGMLGAGQCPREGCLKATQECTGSRRGAVQTLWARVQLFT